MKIYLSAALFSQVERRWNRLLAESIEDRIEGAEVILPQDFKFRASFNRQEDFPRLFDACLKNIEECDLVVGVLDGADVDSGTAFEIGYAYSLGIPVIGIRTDYRQSQDRGLNIMLAQSCTELLRAMSFGEDMDQMVKDLTGKIVAAFKKIQRPPE